MEILIQPTASNSDQLGGVDAADYALKTDVPVNLDDLSDTNTATATHNQVLTKIGSEWTGQTPQQLGSDNGSTLFLDDAASDITNYNVLTFTPGGENEVIDTIVVNNNTVTGESYATPTGGLGLTGIDSNLWEFHTFCKCSTVSGTTTITYDVYKRTAGGTETLLFSATTEDINSTSVVELVASGVQSAVVLDATDRLVVKVKATTTANVDVTVSIYHNGVDHYSHIHTPMPSRALTDHVTAANPHSGSQATLVNTTNIKSINGATILGSGDMPIGVLDLGAILTSDGAYRGMTLTATVDSGNAAVGTLLAQADDFHWDNADADAVANCRLMALSLESGTGSKKLLLYGQLCLTAWNWSAGNIYPSGTAGDMTQVQPSGTDDVVNAIAVSLSADTILFNSPMTLITHT